jgi:ABC-type polysaccharide/polyol phosphate transport system ATPase subunit
METASAVLVMNASITLREVNVEFPFRDPAIDSLRGRLLHFFRPTQPVSEKNRQFDVHALKDVSLHIGEGERVGLIGVNGSGKSTLLKVLAGVLYPSSGSLEVGGKVNAIFDPALGMDPEASGFENIRIRCMLMGVALTRIDEVCNQIAEFSELGDALRRPIKSYSAGMAVRLAFSVATAVDPEILVMDEWLSAGDARFVSKALHRMEDLVRTSRILVLASHSEHILNDWCTRLFWFDRGRLIADGTPQEILADYKKFSEKE